MKAGVGIAVVGVAIAAYWYMHRSAHSDAAAPESHVAVAQSSSTSVSKPIAHATKLANAEERKQLVDRIANAQASRGRAPIHATTAPSLPVAPTLDPDNMEGTKTTIRDAMREVIPMLGECYTKAIPTLKTDEIKVLAKLTLTGDPDIGTVIDAHEVRDSDGNPLPAAFDDCLRDTMQNIALPPLEGGGKLEVHYPFVFSH